MKITGYGEDALTYWALCHQPGAILKRFGDESDPSEIVLYFRPSFGRRGNPPLAARDVASNSQFGEFDAIIGSPHGVYLIEAKWKPSSYADGGVVVLRPEQVFRHKVFRAYLEAWRAHPHATWAEFSAAKAGWLDVGPVRMPIAPANSQLARSLERVLSDLVSKGRLVHDVLLYLQTKQGQSVTLVREPGFELVIINCPSDFGFIDMA